MEQMLPAFPDHRMPQTAPALNFALKTYSTAPDLAQ